MQVRYRSSFRRDIRRVRNASLRRRIERKVAELEAATAISRVRGVEKVESANGNDYRIRIGNYRLGVTVENEVAVLVAFGHRSDIYRRFP